MPSSINDYVPIRELGNGGQGRVLLIQEKANPKNLFACKEIPCPSQNVLDSAVAEIKSLMRLDHPNIIRYEDFFIVAPSNTNSAFDQAFHENIKLGGVTLDQQQQQQQKNPAEQQHHHYDHSFFMFGENNDNHSFAVNDGDDGNHRGGGGGGKQFLTRNNDGGKNKHNNNKTDSKATASSSLSSSTKVYLLTEYCDNGDLSHVIRHACESFFEYGKHPIPESRILEWIAQCCEALDTIHRRFIHRDVKPTNVFLCSKNDFVKLGDFGLATPIQNQNMSLVGTPSYVAPEQMLREKPSSAVDVFGLGATFLEVATLQDRSINAQLLNDASGALEQVVADIVRMSFSHELAHLLRDMLHRFPQDRPTPAVVLQRVRNMINNRNNSNNNNNTATVRKSSSTSLGQQQQQQRLSNSSRNNSPPSMTTASCAVCKVYRSELFCPSCSESFCKACDFLKHHRKELQEHTRSRISPQGVDQQQQQLDSCPNSLGGSFNEIHQQYHQQQQSSNINSNNTDIPPPTMMSNSTRNNSNNTTNNNRFPSTASSSAISPLDPNFINNNTTNNDRFMPRSVPVQKQQQASSKALLMNNNNTNQKPPLASSSSSSSAHHRPNSPFNTNMMTRPSPSPTENDNTSTISPLAGSGAAVSSSTPNSASNIQSILSVYRPTLEVPSARYPTIASALRDAPSGSRILVNSIASSSSSSNSKNNTPIVFTEPLEFPRPDIEIIGNPVGNTTTTSPTSQISSSSSSSSQQQQQYQKPKIEVRGSPSVAIRISGPEGNKIKLINLSISQLAPAFGEKQFALLISDSSNVVVESCDVYSETGTAFGVAGSKCDPMISNCSITANLTGIHISGGASGVIQNNHIHDTGLAGILVKRKACPKIWMNTIENNRQAGIFFFKGGGLAIKNTISTCGGCAFVVKGQGTEPTIRKNQIRNCDQAGILCSDESRGSISENVIYRMRKTAILVKTGASPNIARNIISHGREAGIYVFENGAGRIEENEVVDNENAGIIVTTGGNPFVVSNKVLRNLYEGIWVCKGGKGNFEKNILEGNGRKGPVDIQEGCQVQWS